MAPPLTWIENISCCPLESSTCWCPVAAAVLFLWEELLLTAADTPISPLSQQHIPLMPKLLLLSSSLYTTARPSKIHITAVPTLDIPLSNWILILLYLCTDTVPGCCVVIYTCVCTQARTQASDYTTTLPSDHIHTVTHNQAIVHNIDTHTH